MSSSKKAKYLTKTVTFGSKELTLYSLDGMTWSTRRGELLSIKERQENQRVTLTQLKEETEEDTEKPGSEADSKDEDKEDGLDDELEGSAQKKKPGTRTSALGAKPPSLISTPGGVKTKKGERIKIEADSKRRPAPKKSQAKKVGSSKGASKDKKKTKSSSQSKAIKKRVA